MLWLVRTIAVIIFIFGGKANFNVYWNVPSALCSKKYGINVTDDLMKHRILVNNGEQFIGDKIVIFYENKLGKYPYIDTKKGIYVNGGIPQLANLTEHLKAAEKDIDNMIPDPNFDGIGIIDWESWSPIYDYNWNKKNIYRTRSIELVKKITPPFPAETIKRIAKKQWEEIAKQWMLQTLELAKKKRPKARWCYYLFPDCYNYKEKQTQSEFACRESVRTNNDRLSWLWEASTALCPSIYFYNKHVNYSYHQRLWYLHGRLSEAVRVSSGKALIYPFLNYLCKDKDKNILFDVPEKQFWQMVSFTASMSLDGVVIWGSSSYVKRKENCEALASSVKKVIGPSSLTVSSNFNHCSVTICSGAGRCFWPDKQFISLTYMSKDPPRLQPEEIFCRCKKNLGRYCNVSNLDPHHFIEDCSAEVDQQ